MSTVTQPAAFDATVYDLPIPKADGMKADRLAITVTGTINLDRTDAEHLEMLNRFQLGQEATILCKAVCVGKPSTYRPGDDEHAGELSIRTVLRVISVDGVETR